jgi:orotidine-5'-phosphate decarboxylase
LAFSAKAFILTFGEAVGHRLMSKMVGLMNLQVSGDREVLNTAKSKIIIPLDFPTMAEALACVETLREHVGLFKVGLELFTSVGPKILDELKKLEVEVFLDLKFHDIPNTVAGAVRSTASHGVMMLNVHATGGGAMLKAAVDANKEAAAAARVRQPKLLAVTLLTSMDDGVLKNDLGWDEKAVELVPRLALLAKKVGVDGVVASAQESALIRKACGPDFLIVTPGIRPAWSETGDQSRITTPTQAMKSGSDYIVVGRPITQAKSPTDAAKRLIEEMEQAL